MKKHAIVVVTYNRLSLLKECLEAIEKQIIPYDEIIVVDNASTDGTLEYLESKKQDKKYHIIRETINRGGAGGFSKAIKIAFEDEAEWITIIDDDAILREDFLAEIEKAQNSYGKKNQCFAGVPLTDGIRLGHRRIVTGKWIKKEKAVPMETYSEPFFFCDIASFCGLVIHRSLVEKIGFPLEEFFIWYDDTEYCLRISKISKILNVNKAVIDHKVPTGKKTNLFVGWKDYYGIRNRIYMARKHYNGGTVVVIVVKKIAKCILEALKLVSKGQIKEAMKEIRLYMAAITDGLIGKLGVNKNYMP